MQVGRLSANRGRDKLGSPTKANDLKGVTHTLLGAAVALPIAVSRDPAVAAGCLWLGMVGGGLPDWLDLRSDFRTQLRLKHRGTSHSLVVLAGCSAMLYLALVTLRRGDVAIGDWAFSPTDAAIVALTASLAAGVASHLASDACTYGGIRPFLPFSKRMVWLLPRFLRSRYDGYLDILFRLLAITALAFGAVFAAGRWIVV